LEVTSLPLIISNVLLFVFNGPLFAPHTGSEAQIAPSTLAEEAECDSAANQSGYRAPSAYPFPPPG